MSREPGRGGRVGKAHSVLAFSCCSLPTRPSSPAPALLVLPGGSSRCWQHLLAPKRGKPSHEPLAPMGRGRCGMETPTQEAASLAATSWGVSRALGGHGGLVLSPPGCLGRWRRRGCPWGVPVGLALGAGGCQWLRGPVPSPAAPCWVGGPGGVGKPPRSVLPQCQPRGYCGERVLPSG